MSRLQGKIENLKSKFINFDVFGDNAEELQPYYFKLIDSIKNKDDCEQLKEQFLADDLLYCDPEEIENTQIFKLIDEIISDLN